MCFKLWFGFTDLQLRRLMPRFVLLAALASAVLTALPGAAIGDVSKASDWVGRSVVTDAGQPLGRIEDIAIDIEAGSIAYLVVSIGSFLIEDSLIAVDPDALAPSAQGDALVLFSDSLEQARRFGAENWPAAADVLPSDEAGDGELVAAESTGESGATGFDRGGSAMISDGRRRATFADGERKIEPVSRARSTAADRVSRAGLSSGSEGGSGEDSGDSAAAVIDASTLPLPSFRSLDGNGDGVLSRREIGARLGRSESFPEVDVDASGAVDRFEYELLQAARGDTGS